MFNRTIRSITSTSPHRVILSPTTRSLSTAPRLLRDPKGPSPSLNQGPAVPRAHSSEGSLNTETHQVLTGENARNNPPPPGSVQDAAAERGGAAQPTEIKGEEQRKAANSTQAGQTGSFQDQVGGSPKTNDQSSVGPSTEASAPSFTSNVKQALGMGTTIQDHKESKTAAGRQKGLHTSARVGRPQGDGVVAPRDATGARQTKDDQVRGDQNPHLKHKQGGASDSGKGNAGENPSLPSKSTARSSSTSQPRAYHTSSRLAYKGPDDAAPPPEYVSATYPSAKKAGYDTPGEANPSSNLYEKPPPAPSNLTPSSKLSRSSTAQEPQHETLAENAMRGGLAERNPQPSEEDGKKGLDEAWKGRDNELKGLRK